jgi:hypothetical protein
MATGTAIWGDQLTANEAAQLNEIRRGVPWAPHLTAPRHHRTCGGRSLGVGTFLSGILHTLPFLIPAYRAALAVALATIVFELVALAWIRWRFFATGFLRSFISIAIGGVIRLFEVNRDGVLVRLPGVFS